MAVGGSADAGEEDDKDEDDEDDEEEDEDEVPPTDEVRVFPSAPDTEEGRKEATRRANRRY